MKAEETLKAIKDWAKKGGHRIKVGIRKQPPTWIPAEQRVKSEGVALSLYASDDADSKVWQYWFPESGQNWRYLYEQCEEFESFKNTEKFIELLEDQANEVTFSIFFSEVFAEWAEKNKYEIEEDTGIEVNWFGLYYCGRVYASKDDPEIEHYNYASCICFRNGKVILSRFIIPCYRTTKNGKPATIDAQHIITAQSSDDRPIRTKRALLKWLNKYAYTAYYSDYTATLLDIKSTRRVLASRDTAIHLYVTESATDEAIDELCKHARAKEIKLSEFTYNSLPNSQLAKLLENGANVYSELELRSFTDVETKYRYGQILCKLGRYTDAVSVFIKVFKHYEISASNWDTRSIEEIRPDLLDLCDALIGSQQYSEALKLINGAIKLSTSVNGPENLETLNLLENKGVILLEQGSFHAAAKIFKDLYIAFKKNQGEDHESTIDIKDLYAATLHYLSNGTKKLPNKYSLEAEALYTDLLKHYKKKGKSSQDDAVRIADNLKMLAQK